VNAIRKRKVRCPRRARVGLTGVPTAATSTSPSADNSAIRVYLSMLTGGAPSTHFLEVRFRAGQGRFASEFHPAHDQDAVIDAIRRRSPRTDVYVGCAPRDRRSGTKDAVPQVWTLWAECDGEDSVDRLRRFHPQPAMIIASGSGPNCHAYWPMSAPLASRRAEDANLRLVQALGADRNCFDVGRILRPPGTWNHKHCPPHPVGVLRLHRELRFDADVIVAHLPPVSPEVLERRWDGTVRDGRSDPLLSIPPSIYVADLLGSAPRRNGKVRCPFHDDFYPSLHVYSTSARGWFCFQCRRGGTIYDLAAAVWGLQTRGSDFIEVRNRLAARYGRELAALRSRGLELER
jgi:hypothetical protein